MPARLCIESYVSGLILKAQIHIIHTHLLLKTKLKITNILVRHDIWSKSNPYEPLDTPIPANCKESRSGPDGTTPRGLKPVNRNEN